MNRRITNPTTSNRTPFGLIAWLEQTRVCLPLKAVECRFAVCGDLCSMPCQVRCSRPPRAGSRG